MSKRALLAASAMLLISTAAASAVELDCNTNAAELHCTVASPPSEARRLFTIPREVSAGHMNIRTGPGVNHGLVGAIPAGATVSATQCVPRDDGIVGAYWCLVNWNGLRGWVSQAGLLPIS